MKSSVSFLQYRYIAITLSVVMFVTFIVGTIYQGGFNLGVDFVGGVKLIAKFEKGVKEPAIRKAMDKYNPVVQQLGEAKRGEFIISMKLQKGVPLNTEYTAVQSLLEKNFKNVQFLSVENVGPAIGDFLKYSAIKLFAVAIILMTIYLAFRFEFKYSVGAMVALFHDLILSLAYCGISGVEINIPVIAALLTIFGYSVNDTIVIFDRIRENVNVKSKSSFIDLINKSITQSISRTLLTSLTTLFSVLALFILGGEGLNDFAQVLLFGIFVGTYSSIYIASPVVLGWERVTSR